MKRQRNRNSHSYYISDIEIQYFNLPKSQDLLLNYQNIESETNKSLNRRIDIFLLSWAKVSNFQGQSIKYCKNGFVKTISKREIRKRIGKKIEVARFTGWIQNSLFKTYLDNLCEAYNITLVKN